MQYSADTLLFLRKDLAQVKNPKWILPSFAQISGLRINFHKYELVPLNVPHDEVQLSAQALSCRIGSFPTKYLGVHFFIVMTHCLLDNCEGILNII
jgi:hypothetical protein